MGFESNIYDAKWKKMQVSGREAAAASLYRYTRGNSIKTTWKSSNQTRGWDCCNLPNFFICFLKLLVVLQGFLFYVSLLFSGS